MGTQGWKIRGGDDSGNNEGENGVFETGAYAGVLNRAHQQGLKSIVTTLVQAPSVDNQMTAIFYAEVVTDRGVFHSHGDASPENVDTDFLPRFISVAETRAKARALSDAVNRWTIPVDELMQGVIRRIHPNGNGNGKQPEPRRDDRNRTTPKAITINQLNRLHTLLEPRGHVGRDADAWLCRACNVDEVGQITRRDASALITQMERGASTEEQPDGG